MRVCQLLQGRRVHESFDVLISFTNNSMYRTRYLPNDPTFCRHPRARSGSPCQCRSQTEWSKVWTRNKARQTLTLSSARPVQEDCGNKQTEKKNTKNDGLDWRVTTPTYLYDQGCLVLALLQLSEHQHRQHAENCGKESRHIHDSSWNVPADQKPP